MTTNRKHHLRSEFTLFQTSLILFNFILSQMLVKFSGVESERTISKFKKKKENFCVVFTYTMKQAHRMRTFHVTVMQRWLRNVKKKKKECIVVLLTKPIAFLPLSMPSLLLLLKLPITLIQKFCYHGNMTSHLLSIAKMGDF